MNMDTEVSEILDELQKEAEKLSKDSVQRGNVYLTMACVLLAAIYESVKK